MCEQNKCCMCRQTYNDDCMFLLDNCELFETEYRDKLNSMRTGFLNEFV